MSHRTNPNPFLKAPSMNSLFVGTIPIPTNTRGTKAPVKRVVDVKEPSSLDSSLDKQSDVAVPKNRRARFKDSLSSISSKSHHNIGCRSGTRTLSGMLLDLRVIKSKVNQALRQFVV